MTHLRMAKEIGGHFAVNAGFVLEAFRRGALAVVVVAGKAGVSGKMRIMDPVPIIPRRIAVSPFEPGAVLVAGGFLRVVHGENHGSEKGRLRAREVIRAIGVEYRAVVLDFVKEIFDHAFGELDAAVANEAHDDKVAVPAV